MSADWTGQGILAELKNKMTAFSSADASNSHALVIVMQDDSGPQRRPFRDMDLLLFVQFQMASAQTPRSSQKQSAISI